MALQPTTPFPKITFQAFSNFISSNFNSNISLATVLMVFFTLIENPEILNLHARQKHPQLPDQQSRVFSAWMRALCHVLKARLPSKDFNELFKDNEFQESTWENNLSRKLDGFSEKLGLTPYKNGVFQKQLFSISQKRIQPQYIICPADMQCTNVLCSSRHLTLSSRKRDSPTVTLIKGSSIIKKVTVLTGECSNCHNLYSAHLKAI